MNAQVTSLDVNSKISLDKYVPKNTESQKLLEITFERKLHFNEHISNLCDKAYVFEPKKIVMKAYFSSQFNYCPLVLMNHSSSLNNQINKLN